MSISLLHSYLPPETLPYLQKWFGSHLLHIKVTRDRKSKLGDYRKMRDGSHQISLNTTLQPQLFFFVLTHELAHLLAFEKYGHRIAPHGTEWKNIFRLMILESIAVYSADLQPLLLKFSASPKANFMSSTDLVRYFHIEDYEDESSYIEDLQINDEFIYREQPYLLQGKRKKNYLCRQLGSNKLYVFKPLARVEKIS